MDWLKGMNDVVAHIEKNLREPIAYEKLARIVGCSVYEFFRIFSFMTGMSLAEYIRRRRLSQAALDITFSGKRVIDIALDSGYESPTSFTKAFKELHGTTPSAARKSGAILKTFPPLSFKLTIQGVNEMQFRIEKRDKFTITGKTLLAEVENMEQFTLPSMWTMTPVETDDFIFTKLDGLAEGEEKTFAVPDGGKMTIRGEKGGTLAFTYTDKNGQVKETVHECRDGSAQVVRIGENDSGNEMPEYTLAAFDFTVQNGKVKITVGTEGKHPNAQPDMYREIPAATWAVFSIAEPPTPESVAQAYTRILSEWFPASNYKRDENVPHLEKMVAGEGAIKQPWEIWIPVAA